MNLSGNIIFVKNLIILIVCVHACMCDHSC